MTSPDERDIANRLISDLGLSSAVSSHLDEISSTSSTSSLFSPAFSRISNSPLNLSGPIKRAVAVTKKSCDLQVTKLKGRISELEHEMLMTKYKSAYTSKTHSEQIKNHLKTIESLQALVSSHEKHIEELEGKVRTFQEESERNTRLTREIDDLRSLLNSKEAKMNDLQSKVIGLQHKLSQREENPVVERTREEPGQIENLTRKLLKVTEKMHELDRIRLEKDQDIAALQHSIKNLRNQLDQCVNNNQILENELKQRNEEFGLREKPQISTQILRQTFESLSRDYDKKSQHLSELSVKYDNLLQKFNTLQRQHEELLMDMEKISKLRDEYYTIIREIEHSFS
ncbi:hypothetical protein RCL1_007230 [Eukaryota sp. TZLM3-RCL]